MRSPGLSAFERRPGLSGFKGWKLPAGFAISAAAEAAAITATASTAVAAEPATATTTAIFAGLGLVNREASAVHFFPVELGDGRGPLFFRRHLDEAEASGASSLAVFHDRSRLDRARLRKQLL
jgi:hypothetical protein